MKGMMGFLTNRRWARLALWSGFALAGVIAAAAVVIYSASSWRMARTYDVPKVALRDIGRPASAERGERWSIIYGCQGCHGAAGRVLYDVPYVARLVVPNLSRVVGEYSDEELVVQIRAGIKRDHTSSIGMPTDAFAWMADEDVADLIAWLRAQESLPDAEQTSTSWGLPPRLSMTLGTFPFSADLAGEASPSVTQPAQGLARGEYLEKVLCSHCHRLDEEQTVRPGLIAPPLAPMIHGYDRDQFRALLRTGKAVGERDLELMSEVAVGSFSRLDDEEIAALYDYLVSRAAAEVGAQR
jgi:mono/diheme cytochrome c family protein